MLIIRDEQVEVFERYFFKDTLQRVGRAIASTFPEISGPDRVSVGDATIAPERVKSIVERGMENAAGLDIDDAPDLAAFIALGLSLRLTPPADAEWIQAWLKRTDAPGHTKLRMIESRLRSLAKVDLALNGISERVALARQKAAS